MALMARAAAAGGASGIRASGTDDITAIKAAVRLPVIGLIKRTGTESSVYITPTYEDALAVAGAGADLVAVDATLRRRPDGGIAADLIARILRDIGLPVVADVDSVEAAMSAAAAGATFIATTLSGYTSGSIPDEPDLELVRRIRASLDRPILAEGRYQNPQQVAAAFANGAHAVVVGEAITDPVGVTRRMVGVARAAAAAT
jgi:N-acylglucosamine-6-phosphate 2-epimerase